MTHTRSVRRALYTMVVCAVTAVALWVGAVGIALYYFLTDEEIPLVADRIQFGMFISAGVCAVVSVAMLVCVVVLTVRGHRAGPQ